LDNKIFLSIDAWCNYENWGEKIKYRISETVGTNTHKMHKIMLSEIARCIIK